MKVPGSGFRVPGSGFRVPGSGFRVPESRFRVPMETHQREWIPSLPPRVVAIVNDRQPRSGRRRLFPVVIVMCRAYRSIEKRPLIFDAPIRALIGLLLVDAGDCSHCGPPVGQEVALLPEYGERD